MIHNSTGGLSNGGAAALYYGMKYGEGLAGVFCLSSFLANDSHIFEVRTILLYILRGEIETGVTSSQLNKNLKSGEAGVRKTSRLGFFIRDLSGSQTRYTSSILSKNCKKIKHFFLSFPHSL